MSLYYLCSPGNETVARIRRSTDASHVKTPTINMSPATDCVIVDDDNKKVKEKECEVSDVLSRTLI